MTEKDDLNAGPKLAYVTTIALTQLLFLRGQNEYMLKRGFRLYSLCASDGKLDALVERDSTEAWPIPFTRRLTPFQDLLCLWHLIKAFRAIRPDIVHLSTPKAALLGAIAAYLCRIPVRVYLVRGLFTQRKQGVVQWICRILETATAKLCTQCIFNSPSLMRFAYDQGICPNDVGIVPANGMSNGVDVSRLASKGEQPAVLRSWLEQGGSGAYIIGFLGRLTRDKGIAELIDAWSRVVADRPEARLMLVGPVEKNVGVSEDVLTRLRNDSRVLMTGFIDQKDVGHYYRAMDVFIYYSWGEGFPNAPMEAAAVGLPVVASDAVGCVDAVRPGITGLVAPLRNTEALISAIETYAADPELRRTHGQAGRERVLRDFQPEAIWAELANEYERLIQEERGSNATSAGS